ncbi:MULTISPECIES: hypothetical protein [Halobacterium]|uniref:hypothetical protein n=1 Tax=Halobacterium TaxID=2239 RepID=UPI0019626B26|nr:MULTISPECIES: hypothetical protein [Halobacterium]MCF2166195.1 hypothetical protein [Halobacterium salinarum]MCF2167678.1 hypothetical protein [Halobacterium salinarum]MCF2208319.1 hypothetical protein [Halobacterium salinarum]MCF2237529.1 hypothetical protein [Halobacterium salinarum]MDL0121899.1 hypothetical protein [Halobacterium salinarum]
MDAPQPAGDDWPARPLSPDEARARLDDTADARAVWVMDHDDGVRSTVVPDDAPADAVVDVVVETATGFEMYSYTRGQWMDYGTQRHDDDDAPSMAGTLESYRLLAGESALSL